MRASLRRRSRWSRATWPRVLPAKEDDTSVAGVTGGAWVDSNAGAIRLAQTREPAKQAWLTYSPPGAKEVVPFEEYVRPVAEAGGATAHAGSSRSMRTFAQAVNGRNDRALGVWRQMMGALKLFESRQAWRTWQPVAALAVVSSFQGEISSWPRSSSCWPPAATSPTASSSHPTSIERRSRSRRRSSTSTPRRPRGRPGTALLRFAENGGTVLAPRGVMAGNQSLSRSRYEHAIHSVGRGRLITPQDKWEDPFTLVRQVQLLLSVREDAVQVWNGGDMNSHYLASPGRPSSDRPPDPLRLRQHPARHDWRAGAVQGGSGDHVGFDDTGHDHSRAGSVSKSRSANSPASPRSNWTV